jgi:hypothetical protein
MEASDEFLSESENEYSIKIIFQKLIITTRGCRWWNN